MISSNICSTMTSTKLADMIVNFSCCGDTWVSCMLPVFKYLVYEGIIRRGGQRLLGVPQNIPTRFGLTPYTYCPLKAKDC